MDQMLSRRWLKMRCHPKLSHNCSIIRGQVYNWKHACEKSLKATDGGMAVVVAGDRVWSFFLLDLIKTCSLKAVWLVYLLAMEFLSLRWIKTRTNPKLVLWRRPTVVWLVWSRTMETTPRGSSASLSPGAFNFNLLSSCFPLIVFPSHRVSHFNFPLQQ